MLFCFPTPKQYSDPLKCQRSDDGVLWFSFSLLLPIIGFCLKRIAHQLICPLNECLP
jgi:hypothetical protein